MKKLLSFFLLSVLVWGGDCLLKNNEKLVFGFKTKKGKMVCVALGPKKSYLVYRFGTKKHIEFVYPKDKKDSFSKFTYSSYSRGGGVENMAMDLKYLRFKNKGYLYVIYDEYYSENNQEYIGIRVIKKGKTLADIEGLIKSKKGSLYTIEELIDDGFEIKQDEEEFH